MNASKKWYESKSVWGGIVALLSVVIGAAGYSFAEGDQVALVDAVTTVTAGVGSIIAIYGRVKAKKDISK